MSSTYSPSLRIELIGQGDQVGIWGETTNSNLGTILETAITGNTNVLVTSANQVLTVSNGAPDQSRNAVLVLTTSGAVTTAFNVFAPPVNKTYIVVNNSAYNVTIYNSTIQGNTTPAGTGVTVAAGTTGQMWTNGTNFYVVNTIPLPASQGGTGATTLTANNVLLGNGTNPVNFVAPGTNGNVLTSNGTTWASTALPVAPTIIPVGTLMLFQQTSAPTGWTKQTTHNNKALRVVSGSAGTGGTVNFTTAFASQAVSGTVGNTTLTTLQIPSHYHDNGGSGGATAGNSGDPVGVGAAGPTDFTGGGQSHNHTFTGTAIDLAVQYVDLIIASKD
jgi:hypothetical protein